MTEQVMTQNESTVSGVITETGNLILMGSLSGTMIKPADKQYLKNFEAFIPRMKYFEPKQNFARNRVPLPQPNDTALVKKYNEERRFIQSIRPVLIYMKTSGDERTQFVCDMLAKQFKVDNVSKDIVAFQERELDKLANITVKYIS